MNTHFNSALKQSTAIRRDLAALSSSSSHAPPPLDHSGNATASLSPSPSPTPPQPNSQPPPPAAAAAAAAAATAITPAALGALQASITTFARMVDEYAQLARHEPAPDKRDKALGRIRDFRADLADYRARLDVMKRARDDAQRAELMGAAAYRRPYTGTPENPYASAMTMQQQQQQQHRGARGGGYGMGSSSNGGLGAGGDDAREQHAFREQNFLENTHAALDSYIARGQAVLGDLAVQRDVLKSTQRRLYSVGNTLGISGDTIRMIERRVREDKWMFAAGVVVFFLFCWLVLHFLG